MDWGKIKADNPGKFDSPESIEKGNQVVDACSKSKTSKNFLIT